MAGAIRSTWSESEGVLAIGRNSSIASLLYETSGVQVESARRGIDRIAKGKFDLVIIEAVLPDMDGFKTCEILRESGCTLPILMITPRSTPNAKVRGLQIGADDCLDQPFNPAELRARMDALRRRSYWDRSREQHRFGNLEMDFRKGCIFRAGKRVKMSEREFAILRYLVERPGKVVSRDQLLLSVWGYTFPPHTRTVDVHIASLRKKLEGNPRSPKLIVTVHSQGYRVHA